MRSSRSKALAVLALLAAAGYSHSQNTDAAPAPKDQANDSRAWMRQVRIAAWGLRSDNADQIVREATASGVYGIEVDNDIPGRYESLLDPTAKLAAIRKVAQAAHAAGNHAFVYIAGTECISKNSSGSHTLGKEHPDWLQRKKTGEPALFSAGSAFWISKGEEDAWVSPYAQPWRKLYMQRVRQIAATGIDGIYVDIPYWMTHFTGWGDTWASFDDATVAAFKQQTGLDARTQVHLGDPEDPGFRKWVAFRIETINNFMSDIRSNAIAVNPQIAVIPEIYPGIEEAAPRVGADVYQLYPVVDAVAHEYEFGEGEDHTAASRTPFDWMMYQIGIRSFRAFAEGKPTWILNYSWDGAPNVPPRPAMLTLANSELMAGANVWDARGHVMSGSNDLPTRKETFHWIADHENIFGALREPVGDVGVYFSDQTRNLYPEEFIAAYRGTTLFLLQNHTQFRIVTPRTLAAFTGKVLALPDVRILSTAELASLKQLADRGTRLVLTGKTDAQLDGLPGALRLPGKPDSDYLERASTNFAASDPNAAPELSKALAAPDPISVKASKNLVAHASRINGGFYVFLANFDGLAAGKNETPAPQHGVQLTFPASYGQELHWLPFMGTETTLHATVAGTDKVQFELPPVEHGGVAFFPATPSQ